MTKTKPEIKSKNNFSSNKLSCSEYRSALNWKKKEGYATKRLNLLLLRIVVRIEKVNKFLSDKDVGDKELKSKISLLSSLFEVKKKIKSEIKELTGETDTSENLFG